MKTKILYDGNCVVCDLEISHYQRMAPTEFELIDISQKDFDAAKFQLTGREVIKNLHVITPEGELRIGVDAFAHIWSRIERYKFATKLIKNALVNPVAKVGYAVFTVIRPYLPKRS
jgi:predicted DCC family thiol-disulfide oxidoreductase YuxK